MKLIRTTLVAAAATGLTTSAVLAACTEGHTSTELSATTSAPAVAGEGWMADFDAAAALAKKENKNLIVDFTGSDWCSWCIRLDKEVFAHEEWSSVASKDYVFVALDFPNSEEAKAKVPNPERNKELQSEYAVQGFPTILLMTPDGDVFGRTGYQEGGPAKYLEHMATLKAEGLPKLEEANKLVAAFDAAEGEAQVAAFQVLAAKLEEGGSDAPGARKLLKAVRTAMDKDADGKLGMRLPAMRALLAAGVVDDELVAAAMEADPKNEEGLYERCILARLQNVNEDSLESAVEGVTAFDALGTYKDKAVAFEIYLAGAVFSARYLEKPEQGKVFAQKGLDLGYTENAQWTKMLEDMVKE